MNYYQSQFWAHALTLKQRAGSIESLSRSIGSARVDLNPHQVEAALFALRSPFSKGALLADEVGLGKTIEAGIVISQRWAEGRRRIVLIVPATLRKQWQQELDSKFYIPSVVLDTKKFMEHGEGLAGNPFTRNDRLYICSYNFASSRADALAQVPWELVVLDEAHRLRNVYKNGSITGRNILDAIGGAPKLLLTATPLQNSLMELYGLVNIIDPFVFGDPESFRDRFIKTENDKNRNRELRERLTSVCVRTLRKQVTEYIPFTKRIPITQDFSPSDDEQRLYDQVSAYLQKEELFAIPTNQHGLITIVLRKLLASSTFAIAGTLNNLVDRLEKAQKVASIPTQLIDDNDLEGVETLQEELAEADEEVSLTDPLRVEPTRAELLRDELAELRNFASLANSIRSNAKGDALAPALNVAFQKAEELGAPRKAVIFTESRRTQQYLFDLLSSAGYQGKIVLINGSNSDPTSRQIYEAWARRHHGEEIVSGSRAIDIKAALVEHFRDEATILIATEAAAEGVNLQFASLVVNFDLPWNPQRIEQRIGRCHRYGQQHDVVVVNFINRRNLADQRVYELLNEKFSLFHGVFGASDDVLGAIDSGVDFEKRIARVYQTCRTPGEIEAAFDALRKDLQPEIDTRLEKTREALLENFDEDVSARLRLSREKTLDNLSTRERWLLELARTELGPDAQFELEKPRFRLSGDARHSGTYNLDWRDAEKLGDHFLRQDHPLALRILDAALQRKLDNGPVIFDYAKHGKIVSIVKPLIGTQGWLALSKLTVESMETEEFLVFAAIGEGGATVDTETCVKLFSLPMRQGLSLASAPPQESLDAIRSSEVNALLREVKLRNAQFFDEEVQKLDRWSEDLKLGLEREIRDLDKAIREARRQGVLSATLEEKLSAQRALKAHESQRKQKRRDLYEEQDKIDDQRGTLIGKIEKQLDQRHSLQPLFTIRFAVE